MNVGATRPNELSDEEVVELVKSGRTELFELIMRRHNQRLYRAARAILRDDVEAEDVMQEAYVLAFSHLGAFEGRAKFSTWLTRIAVHEALARLRRRGRFQAADELAEAVDDMEDAGAVEKLNWRLGAIATDAPKSPEDAALSRELRGLLEHAIDGLPDHFRSVFMLRAVEDMSVAETAVSLDIPEDTVKSRLFRARGLLQKALLDAAETSAPGVFPFFAPRCNRVVEAVLRRISKPSEPAP